MNLLSLIRFRAALGLAARDQADLCPKTSQQGVLATRDDGVPLVTELRPFLDGLGS